jgi:hypothetical protein
MLNAKQKIKRQLELILGKCSKGAPIKVRTGQKPTEPMTVGMDSSQC